MEVIIVSESGAKKRYYRKHVDFFRLLHKIKLWPSRTGMLHGIKSINEMGEYAEVITHCNKKIMVRNSKNSRVARWLRNKMIVSTCPACGVPKWKLEKYSSTFFTQHYGSHLNEVEKKNTSD